MLAAATLVNTFGNGLLLTVSVLFFTRSVGLSAGLVGLGLTIAGALGLLVGVPLGTLADRRGPRELLIWLLLGQAAATAGYLLVRSFPSFLVAACFVVALNRGASAVRQGLIATVLPADKRVAGRAYLRVVTNVGVGLGSAVAALALHLDTRAAYVALIIGDVVTYLVAAPLTARLPHVPPVLVGRSGPRLPVLRDRPYVAVTLLSAVLSLQYGLLEVGVPLWVAEHTQAPRVMVAVLFVFNTAVVVALQVRASRGSDDVRVAAAVSRRSGLLFAVACALFALAGFPGAGLAVVLLVAAGTVHVLGELLQAAGSWGLAFGLAPEGAQGQYQGLSSTGFALSTMLAPLVMAAVVTVGWVGWLCLGVLFAAAGALTVPVTSWALKNRPTSAGAH